MPMHMARFLPRLTAVAAVGALSLVHPAFTQERTAPADSLVEAERSFSRLAGKIGHVAAFLAYFADDVVTFQPAPGAGKERLREAAAKMAVPPAVRLDWEPWFADAADAGDLGYTTGPSIFTEASTGKVLRTGWYFSIWKHDANGWRVAADIGIEAPAVGALRPKPVEFASSQRVAVTSGGTSEDILALERRFAGAIADQGPAKAYSRYLGPSSRLYRDGAAPVVGAEAVTSFLASQAKPLGCRAAAAGVSRSRDLAYSVGECDVASASGTAPAKAGFLRAWKSGPNGWRLAADVVTR